MRMPEVATFPSGKRVMRTFNRAGELTCETHSYADAATGLTAILVSLRFSDGRKVRELYCGRGLVDGALVPGRVIRRETYEEQRLPFADMPAADASVVDESAEHLEKMERKQRAQAAAAARLGMDPAKLTEIDLFCAELMEQGEQANAVEWIQAGENTLGEMDHAESRKLIDKLLKLGAVAIFACEIDAQDANTGHLVVQLPPKSPARKALRRELARLAREQGCEGDPEKGQQYAYVKLD
jgi:hypothetical protein